MITSPILYTHHDGFVARIDFRGQPSEHLSQPEAEAALKRYRKHAQLLADGGLVIGAGLADGIANEIEAALAAIEKESAA